MINNIKHEFRQMFNNGKSINIFDDTEHLEDGLLERIVNLSILNPTVFPYQQWTMLAVKSSMTKHKLSAMCCDDDRLSACAVCLIVLEEKQSASDYLNIQHEDKQLLKTSIMYASKYYSVDSYVIDSFNKDGIRKYFNIDNRLDIVMLICLGFFNNTTTFSTRDNLKSYSQAVREV